MNPRPLILRTGAWVAVPILLLFAVVLFWQGHNAPGGGFIAGLLTAGAIVLRYIARGRPDARGESAPGVTTVAVGLALALATALGAVVFGHSFFTHTFTYVELPLVGQVELATASLFDLGVMIVVVGNVVTVIEAMTDRD